MDFCQKCNARQTAIRPSAVRFGAIMPASKGPLAQALDQRHRRLRVASLVTADDV